MAVIGERGPSVLLSAETAYLIETVLKASTLRVRMRGRNPKVSEELLELRHVAMQWDPTSLPEVGSDVPEVAPGLTQWLSPVEAADLLGMTDRGVRLACHEGRLVGEQVGAGGRWRISRAALDDYRAMRTT